MKPGIRLIGCLCSMLLLLPLSAMAVDDLTIYVIKKGDTLWGLSDKFLNNPRHWPNLWSKNQAVTNPHLIFPGQMVRFVDGHLEVVEPPPQEEPVFETPAEPEQVAEEKTFTVRGNEGGLLERGIRTTGSVLAGHSERLILGANDTIYTDIGRQHGGTEGKKYTLLRNAGVVTHPYTKEVVGHKVYPLGSIQLTRMADKSSHAVILDSFKEVIPGDMIVPYHPAERREVVLKAAEHKIKGVVVASYSGKAATASGDVIYLDIGRNKGVQPGYLLYVAREVKVDRFRITRDIGKLPREVTGAIVVVSAGQHTSTAIVVKSIDAVFVGDQVFSMPR